MKRSEFLKRLGLGAVAAVAAPALLASKDESNGLSGYGENVFESKSDKCDMPKRLLFKHDGGEWMELTSTSSLTLEIPPLEPGKYNYEMTFEDKPILSGIITAE